MVIGGHGKKRTPRLAATYADEFNLPFAGVQAGREQFARVRRACEDLGRDPGSLRLLMSAMTAGGQVFGILLCRTYFATLPQELFDAAKVDGASELEQYFRIALPLSWPILVTLAIMHLVGSYNDFIWPLLTISDQNIQVVTVGLTQFRDEFGTVTWGPRRSEARTLAARTVPAWWAAKSASASLERTAMRPGRCASISLTAWRIALSIHAPAGLPRTLSLSTAGNPFRNKFSAWRSQPK